MNIVDELKKWLESEEGKKAMAQFVIEEHARLQLKQHQMNRVRGFFKNEEDFSILMHKIIDRHTEEYKDNCYKNGYMPHPDNLLSIMFDIAEEEGVELEEGLDGMTSNWPSNIYDFMGWQFATTFGQGPVYSVFKNCELIYRD